MPGHYEGAMYKELKCVIPTAAAFSSAILVLFSVASDLSGAIGSFLSNVCVLPDDYEEKDDWMLRLWFSYDRLLRSLAL